MTRIYQISITHTSLVAADDRDEAWDVAHDQASEILADEEYEVNVDHEITKPEMLPKEWSVKCVPWGGIDGETIEKILASLTPAIVRDTNTIDMFPEVA